MKNKYVLFGITGIILAIITACNNPFSSPKKETPVNPEVPVISAHPQSAEYFIGEDVDDLTVSALVSDKGTLSYQWYSNEEDSNEGGILIEGATETSYTPPVDTAGTVYYYVTVTNTLNKETAAAVSNVAAITVYEIEEGATIIDSVVVTVTAPTKGSTPNTAATAGSVGYTCGAVSWSPGDVPFLGGAVYTATVTLTADDGYVFVPGLIAKINNHEVEASAYSVNAVTLSFAFDATLTKTVTGIAI